MHVSVLVHLEGATKKEEYPPRDNAMSLCSAGPTTVT